MLSVDGKYVLHHVFDGKDKEVGSFEIKDGAIVFKNSADEHNCDVFPSGPMSAHTKNKFVYLLDNDHKSMYVTKA